MENSSILADPIWRPKTLIIIGASTRAACQSARRSGFECWCIDQFGDDDLVQNAARVSISRDWPFDLVDLARQAVNESPDPAILLAGGPENHVSVVAEFCKLAPLLGCDVSEISRLRDPAWIQNTLAASSLPALAVQMHGMPDPTRTWIRKRFKSSGGIGVRRFEPCETKSQEPSPIGLVAGEFVQEFVETRNNPGAMELSGLYLVNDESVQFLGLCQQWIGEQSAGASGFQYSGSVGPLAYGIQMSDSARHAVSEADGLLSQARAVGDSLLTGNGRGLVGIDFVWEPRSRSLFCLEVNPRYTASIELYERIYGWPTITWHVDVSCGLLGGTSLNDALCNPMLATTRRQATCAAKLIVYATRDSLSPAWRDVTSNASWPSSVEIADRPASGTPLFHGQPVCTLLTTAETPSDCKQRLISAAGILDL